MPIVKATSKNVAINDGGADRTRKTKWVTFYAYIDSIKVKVKPGTKFDFIVLLNGKDSCYTVLRDPRGVKYETKIVIAPLLQLNNFELTNIPTLVLGSKNPAGFEINTLGNDLLKRFNIILDFQNDYQK